jgi:electron transfer flavoprotein alpha subunit
VGDTWVIVEHLEAKIAEISFEMLGKARDLAAGEPLVAVLLGKGVNALVGELGAADTVLMVEDAALAEYTPEAYGNVLVQLAKARQPRLVLVANTAIGMDLAAGLSGALGMPLVAYCRELTAENGSLLVVSQLYGGKLLVESALEGGRGIVTILAGAFKADRGKKTGSPQIDTVPCPPLGPRRIRFKALVRPQAGDVDITKEAILVSVGRGIQLKENIPIVQELADALGGTLSASRPIVDNGWLPKTRQVGKSGMSVKPKLYVAVGISGAPEHIEGMRDAGLIVAINSDQAAPIFNVAHYGIVGDLMDVVPLLTERAKAVQ